MFFVYLYRVFELFSTAQRTPSENQVFCGASYYIAESVKSINRGITNSTILIYPTKPWKPQHALGYGNNLKNPVVQGQQIARVGVQDI